MQAIRLPLPTPMGHGALATPRALGWVAVSTKGFLVAFTREIPFKLLGSAPMRSI